MGEEVADKKQFKEFISSQEADDWGNNFYREWLEKIQLLNGNIKNNNISNPLYLYTGNLYLPYNRFLRGQIKPNKKQANIYSKDIETIKNEISKFELYENIIVYRYTYKTHFKKLFENSTPKVGEIFIEKGFASTTLVKSLLEDFAKKHRYKCLLKMYLPKGTKGVYIKFNDCLNEQEFLLPPNAKFVLNRKRLNFNLSFPIIYECELIEQ